MAPPPATATNPSPSSACPNPASQSQAKPTNYGFVIDNRRCIGCHACTVACKSEHQDPIGINKTWVTYLEKGVYPHTSRDFHVMRCNHCANAPCVEICPTASLETRADGIVDFDPGRCIGCKACMQACPYDAITINPETNTATKCNYCAHRVDVGRAPACVAVCPVEAIIVGDLNDPVSPVSALIASEMTVVRKPEKGTEPNLYYIRGDRAALEPSASYRSTTTIWGTRPADAVDAVNTQEAPRGANRRTYDIPQRHAGSWGWKVSAYLFTKSIAAGAFLVPAILGLIGVDEPEPMFKTGVTGGLVFLAITGFFLVADLKRPERFLWVMLRPNWRSWLVRGAYIIGAYGAFLSLWWWIDPDPSQPGAKMASVLGGLLGAATAAYSGWLFGQAKGRDLWQSSLAPFHLLTQSIVAGAAFLIFFGDDGVHNGTVVALQAALIVNLLLVVVEVWGRHATRDATRAARLMETGNRGLALWGLVLIGGHVLPLLFTSAGGSGAHNFAALLALLGLATYEHLWVDAPQRIALA